MIRLGDRTSKSTDTGRITYEWIGPELAARYLEEMPGNRAISHRLVIQLTEAAKNGTFYKNVAPIHFDKLGKLRNGQHRMWMVIESGIQQEFSVIRGASEEEIAALDTGKKRTMGDVLSMAGYPNGSMLGGALTNMWLYQYGTALPGQGRNMFTKSNQYGLSNQNVMDYVEEHPRMQDSAAYMARTPAVRLLGSPAMLAFAHYVICETNPVDGPEFFNIIATQRFEGQDDPAFRLFERLKRMKSQKEKHMMATSTEIGALTIRAFNLWVEGTTVKQLRWRRGNDMATRDDFPRPLVNKRRYYLEVKA